MSDKNSVSEYRFLYLTSVPPFPVKTGGRLRSNLLYRALRRLGTVDLVVYGNTPIAPAEHADLKADYGLIAELLGGSIARRWKGSWPFRFNRDLAEAVTYNFAPRDLLYATFPDMQAKLQDVVSSRTYDAIVVRYLVPALQCGAAELGIPCFVDLDDFDLDYYKTRARAGHAGRLERLVLKAHIRNLELCLPAALARLPHTWLSNPANLADPLLARGVALPNAVLPPASIPTHPSAPIAAFIGSFHWAPNVTAVDYFLSEIWPALMVSVPEAQFIIAGSNLGPKRLRVWSAIRGVTVLGYVADIAEVYARALFTVAPLTMGSGTSIKSIESLQYARACVATPLGARGLEANPALVVADSTDEFIGVCRRLLKDPAGTAALGHAGSAPAERQHSFAQFATTVENSLATILDIQSRRVG